MICLLIHTIHLMLVKLSAWSQRGPDIPQYMTTSHEIYAAWLMPKGDNRVSWIFRGGNYSYHGKGAESHTGHLVIRN